MDNKPIWLQWILENIRLTSIIALVGGASAMITFILTVWQNLSFTERIVASVSLIVFFAMVFLFVYGQTKKTLNVIPLLLYKIHSIAQRHIIEINIADMNEQDLLNWLNLIDFDKEIIAIASSVKDWSEIPSRFETLYSKYIDKDISDDDVEDFINYFISKSNLQKILESDKQYIKIMREINRKRLSIPTEAMALAVNKFLRDSNSANCLSVLCQIPAEILPKLFTPKLEAKFLTMNININKNIATSLAIVKESIDRYYNRAYYK